MESFYEIENAPNNDGISEANTKSKSKKKPSDTKIDNTDKPLKKAEKKGITKESAESRIDYLNRLSRGEVDGSSTEGSSDNEYNNYLNLFNDNF